MARVGLTVEKIQFSIVFEPANAADETQVTDCLQKWYFLEFSILQAVTVIEKAVP